MIINLGHGYRAEWVRGSHYVNLFDSEDTNYDCVSFCWDKDRPTQLDALSAFRNYENQDY